MGKSVTSVQPPVNRDRPIRGPEDHAALLHPWITGNHGLVTVARRLDGRWRETAIPLNDLGPAVRELRGQPDTYISQNRFKGSRRIAFLWQLDSLWADLDYHKMVEWAGKDPRWVLEAALERLSDAQVPAPTFAVATGRGLALVWVHTAVPRGALPRWNACQQHIYRTLKPLGADRLALDAARVLRIVGTQHARSGHLVEALTGVGKTWEFDTLADEVLPLRRAELNDLRIQRAARRAKTALEATNRPRQAFNAETLWEGRLADLQTLLQLRWWGQLPPGQRDHWLFLAINAMSWLAPPEVLYREAWALAKQAGGWDEQETATRLHAIFKRARMAAQGQTIEWNGQTVDPRYHFRTETMIEWVGITPEEQRKMRVLIGSDEKRRRHREAERERKRQVGETTQDRAEYLESAKAIDKRDEARALKEKGMATVAIARKLGVSRQRVQQYLQEGCKGSVPLYGGTCPSARPSGTGPTQGA